MYIVNKKRPVNLDIGTIELPITSYVSILHRVSGVALFGAIAVSLWLLDTSPICQLIVWAALAGLAYHIVAGVRHLIMDFGVGETLEGGRLGAKIVLFVAVVLIILAGVWVWV